MLSHMFFIYLYFCLGLYKVVIIVAVVSAVMCNGDWAWMHKMGTNAAGPGA